MPEPSNSSTGLWCLHCGGFNKWNGPHRCFKCPASVPPRPVDECINPGGNAGTVQSGIQAGAQSGGKQNGGGSSSQQKRK
jgi:hypothetical protein